MELDRGYRQDSASSKNSLSLVDFEEDAGKNYQDIGDSGEDENDDLGAAGHESLHRFMVDLLDEASVIPLRVFLIQDNAFILKESASQSARAAKRKFALGRFHHDHLITKEISRWESYPYQVDAPIAMSKPSRKVKNGCVPQRRAKRRSGLESPGEIKAEIVKKAESLPKPPRRRSSVKTTDGSQKVTLMQQELLELFETSDCDVASSNDWDTVQSTEDCILKMKDSWLSPKQPVRRPSRRPSDVLSDLKQSHSPKTVKSNRSITTNNYNAKSIQDLLMGKDVIVGDGSQHSDTHSLASTETTLSDINARNADLFMEATTMDCSVILEEDDDNEDSTEFGKRPAHRQKAFVLPPTPITPPTNNDGRRTRQLSPQRNKPISIPKKPERRISEAPESLADQLDDLGSVTSLGSELSSAQPPQP